MSDDPRDRSANAWQAFMKLLQPIRAHVAHLRQLDIEERASRTGTKITPLFGRQRQRRARRVA